VATIAALTALGGCAVEPAGPAYGYPAYTAPAYGANGTYEYGPDYFGPNYYYDPGYYGPSYYGPSVEFGIFGGFRGDRDHFHDRGHGRGGHTGHDHH